MKLKSLHASLVVAAGFLLGGCCTVKKAPPTMEYKVDTMWVKTQKPMAEFQQYLNAQSDLGWRLVGFEEHDNNFRVVLGRPKQ